MMTIALFAAGLLAAPVKPSSSCKPGATEVLSCRKETPSRGSKSVAIRNCGGRLVAAINQPGPTDKPVEMQSWFVKHKAAAGGQGAAEAWAGIGAEASFKLTVNFTTSPIIRGGHRGNLEATVAGQKIKEQFICARPPAPKPSDACKSGASNVMFCVRAAPVGPTKSASIRNCGGKFVATVVVPGPDATSAAADQVSWFVKRKAAPAGVVGGSESWTGDGFKLGINWTTTPVIRGGHKGHLTCKSGRVSLDEDFVCQRTVSAAPQ